MKKPAADTLAARRIAVGALVQVLGQGRHHEDAYAVLADKTPDLSPADRAFARLLLITALRRLGQLDAVLAQALTSPAKKMDPRVEAMLRVGTVQLLFLGTPSHAAVDTMVNLTARDKLPQVRGAKGLVNAVLRRIAQDGAELLAKVDSERAAVPLWLWQSWTRRYGEDAARRIITAGFQEPALDLTLKSPDQAGDVMTSADVTASPTGGLRLQPRGRIEDLPGFRKGRWWVQDAAAALPAQVLRVNPGDRILDMCAAPGGKTLQLAAMGAKVTALDLSDARLSRLQENLARTGLMAEVVATDARTYTAAPFDAVLLDAPCSATGTIRRHPEIAWLRTPADVASLTSLQRDLLEAAARLTRPGGTLVYAVCSLEAAEGPDQLAAFLSAHQDFVRDPLTAADLKGVPDALLPTGDAQTLPYMAGGMDGFFIARLRRRT